MFVSLGKDKIVKCKRSVFLFCIPAIAIPQSYKYPKELDLRLEKVLNFDFSKTNYELSAKVKTQLLH